MSKLLKNLILISLLVTSLSCLSSVHRDEQIEYGATIASSEGEGRHTIAATAQNGTVDTPSAHSSNANVVIIKIDGKHFYAEKKDNKYFIIRPVEGVK